MNVDISIVVPSRGRGPKLRRLLAALAQQTCGPGASFEVLIALDGEPHDTVQLSANHYAFEVRVLPLSQVGISAAKNAACAAARGRILLFVNDDIEPRPDFLRAHAEAHAAGESIVLGATPWQQFDQETVFDEAIARTGMIFFYDRLAPGRRYDFRHAWNLNLSVDRKLVDGLEGPFASKLRPFMYEDIEFAYRIMGCEARVAFQPAARAIHNHRYTLPEYLKREAMLGVMAPELSAVNPACFQAIFGSPLRDVVASARRGLSQDVRDGRRMLEKLLEVASRPAHGTDLETFYLAHLPLKRRAYRAGLVLAVERPETPWRARVGLAADALASDEVFSDLPQGGGARIADIRSVERQPAS